ncbi:MAG TPA: hypothetical protein VGE62_00165 [Candidatus Paceibacterota bacterium]
MEKIEGSELAEFGFVHVTGLPLSRACGHEGAVEATVKMLGSYATNNGYVIVVTRGGKVWLSYGALYGESSRCMQIICSLCLPENRSDKGMGTASAAIVDCTEQIPQHCLLNRFRDPSWQPEG